MCGIAGIHGREGLEDASAVVRRMTDAQAHRGPDAEGVWEGGNAVLGHRRLSIIDLSDGGRQPFVSADGRYALVFNGEIYNYRELRAQLPGWDFRTGSDTEVLLAAWCTWGVAALTRLEGMFAFAVHDNHSGELVLVRDRMGIKPLYVFRDDRHLLFASEVRALLASGMVPRRLDREALVDYLRYQTVHAPATIVEGVRMLPAGHLLRVSDQEVHEQRWWDLVAEAGSGMDLLPKEEVLRGIRDRLAGAVEKRLVADVPFGAFLSGGIDSSAVVGLMAQATQGPVHTFSVVFDEQAYSEERYARLVAKRFSTKHTAIRLEADDMLRALPEALAAMDHPSGDGPNTFVVSRETKAAGITMALSGLGGDELFAGYPVFARTLMLWERRWVTQFPEALRRMAGAAARVARPGMGSLKMAELLRLPAWSVDDTYPVSRLMMTDAGLRAMIAVRPLPGNRVAAILRDLIRGRGGHALPFLSQVSIAELSTYLQHVLLRDTDQMSMAHALEVRVPFLDHDLVSFVLGVGDGFKFPHSPKPLLVEALGDLLPTEIVDRPKMGFTLPWPQWMRSTLRSYCEARLLALGRREEFNGTVLQHMWNSFLKGDPRMPWARLWYLVVLEDWLDRHGVS